MLQNHPFLFCILLLVLLQSCSSSPNNIYYAPEEHNMLKLANKNDIKAALSSSSLTRESSVESNLNVQAAYSPIKHLGVFGNFISWNNRNNNAPDNNGSIYKIGSAAVGGYYLLENKNQKIRNDTLNSLPLGFLVDIYLGGGLGKVDNYYREASESFINFNKTYGQIGIHWQDEYVGLSWVMRFNKIYFRKGVFNGKNDRGIGHFQYIQQYQNFNFRESTLKLFMGNKEARAYVSWTNVVNRDIFLDNINYISSLPSVDSVWNLGVVFGISDIFQSIKENKNNKIR